MSKLFDTLQKQTKTLVELQIKAYKEGYEAGHKAKEKELLAEAEREQAISEDYPLGKMIEPYDIWRENRAVDNS